jgi:hypothetical protein
VGRDVEIKGYGVLRIPTSSGKYLALSRVAHCPEMPINLVSLRKLMTIGVFFEGLRVTLRRANGCSVHRVIDKFDQFVLHEFRPRENDRSHVQGAIFKAQRREQAKAEGHLWHLRMGHAGAQAIERLETVTRNAQLKVPDVADCEACAMSKTRAQISRTLPEAPQTHPFDEISVDMHPMDTGFAMSYTLMTDSARSILGALFDTYYYTHIWFKIRRRKVHSDNELMADNPDMVLSLLRLIHKPRMALQNTQGVESVKWLDQCVFTRSYQRSIGLRTLRRRATFTIDY